MGVYVEIVQKIEILQKALNVVKNSVIVVIGGLN